ncbi:glycosyltransferase [Arcobacter peruensis]|uniref:glycosyltransferase n=1 Tax=Arcobacter peruensis TaxID=2320140 RepID=UPI000F097544|nr:glycosyltransferase [Arcobacter peruensis]
MNLKLCGVVILYKPDYEEVLKNISSYLNSLEKLYVINNSKIDNSFVSKLNKFDKIQLINPDSNIGISKALNLALNISNKDGFSWLLTMDQDTSFFNNSFDTFLESFKEIDKKSLIIYSPIHNKKFLSKEKSTHIEKDFVMTSGNILNIAFAKEIGGFEEKFFIDEVDHEFCFKAIKNKYKILQNMNISVDHELGEKINSFTIYKPFRLYYMIRNYLYFRKTYFSAHEAFFKKRDKYLLKFFSRHILFSKERITCIKMLFLGFTDYKNKKFGKLNNDY